MSINFNLWFIKDGTVSRACCVSITKTSIGYSTKRDEYYLKMLKPGHNAQAKSIRFRDTVRAQSPALISPCDY